MARSPKCSRYPLPEGTLDLGLPATELSGPVRAKEGDREVPDDGDSKAEKRSIFPAPCSRCLRRQHLSCQLTSSWNTAVFPRRLWHRCPRWGASSPWEQYKSLLGPHLSGVGADLPWGSGVCGIVILAGPAKAMTGFLV